MPKRYALEENQGQVYEVPRTAAKEKTNSKAHRKKRRIRQTKERAGGGGGVIWMTEDFLAVAMPTEDGNKTQTQITPKFGLYGKRDCGNRPEGTPLAN